MPSISVIILAYREPDFLNALLASLALQTLPPAEILIVDDASGPDYTSRYQLPKNARLLINPQNLARAAISRNRALREAQGQFLAFVDQDDLWHPEKLALQTAALLARPDALMHYCHAHNIDLAGRPLPHQPPFKPLGKDPLAALLWGGVIGYSSVMLPRTALDRVGLFDESIRAAADWDMWLRLAAAGPILEDPRPLMLRRRHARQWSKSRLLIAQADEKVLAKTLAWLPATRPDLVPFARRRYARALRRLACAHLAQGRPAEGMTFLRQSATIAPLNLRTYALMLRARFMRHP